MSNGGYGYDTPLPSGDTCGGRPDFYTKYSSCGAWCEQNVPECADNIVQNMILSGQCSNRLDPCQCLFEVQKDMTSFGGKYGPYEGPSNITPAVVAAIERRCRRKEEFYGGTRKMLKWLLILLLVVVLLKQKR